MPESLFYAVDAALNAWDHIRQNQHLFHFEHWTLQDFVDHVFVGWETKVILREQNAGAVLVVKDGGMLVMPVYWPTGWDAPGDTSEPDDDEDDDALAPTWRETAFDTALTDSVSGTGSMELIELLIEHEWDDNAKVMRLATSLAVEAILLNTLADQQDAIRMLLALQGMNQRTGYQRIV